LAEIKEKKELDEALEARVKEAVTKFLSERG
jgi:hypothetical protein